MAGAYAYCGSPGHQSKVSSKSLEYQITTLKSPPSYPIIKRRIAWLIGKWISESCASPNNPRVWEILTHLLKDRGPGTDTVVRLTAAVALQECLDVRKLFLWLWQY